MGGRRQRRRHQPRAARPRGNPASLRSRPPTHPCRAGRGRAAGRRAGPARRTGARPAPPPPGVAALEACYAMGCCGAPWEAWAGVGGAPLPARRAPGSALMRTWQQEGEGARGCSARVCGGGGAARSRSGGRRAAAGGSVRGLATAGACTEHPIEAQLRHMVLGGRRAARSGRPALVELRRHSATSLCKPAALSGAPRPPCPDAWVRHRKRGSAVR